MEKLNGTKNFRSETIPNVNFEVDNAVTGRSQSLTQSFGPYRIDES